MESKSESKYDGSQGGWKKIEFKEIELGDRIGGGGIGVIYNGRYKHQDVALKTLFDTRVSEELKQQYMDELLVMSRVKHSNIVTFIGACMTPPNLFFVMEKCEASLFDILHVSTEPISERESVRMAIDVGSAMEYLHALKPAVIHRDLKSHNILRAYDGSLKICDFGLVSTRVAQAGTPPYMAPELIAGRSFNKSVDAYAFAILLWEIFARQVPFYMVEVFDIYERVRSGDRPRLSSAACSRKCSQLISRAWSQDAEDRPDFTEIVDTLMVIYDETVDARFVQSIGGDALDSIMGGK